MKNLSDKKYLNTINITIVCMSVCMYGWNQGLSDR